MNTGPNKKELILDAAAKMFARKGFAGTVMEDISTAAGVAKGTLYAYFPSKADLFFALFETFMSTWIAELNALLENASGSCRERLITLNETVLGSWAGMKDLFSLTMEFWSASAAAPQKERFKAAFKSAYADMRKSVGGVIEKGITAGEFSQTVDAASVAAALVGFWDCMFLQAWFDDEFDLAFTGRAFFQVVLNGMTVRRAA